MKKILLIILVNCFYINNINAQSVKAVPNGDFEQWSSYNTPIGWQSTPPVYTDTSGGVSRSSDHYTGSYSVRLITEPDLNGQAQLTTGHFFKFNDLYYTAGGVPYTLKTDTLTGYYKYATTGKDSGIIDLYLLNKSNLVGGNSNWFPSSSTWKYFEMPFKASSNPDTMRIDITVSTNVFGNAGNSTLYVDNLKLKSQLHTSGFMRNFKSDFLITAFPNPAQNQLNIRFTGDVPKESPIKIYNIEGRLMIDNQFNSGGSTITVPISQLSAGLYFYEVTANRSVVRNKFLKN